MAFPVDASRLATNTTGAGLEFCPLNLPATIDAGDTLLAIYRMSNNTLNAAPSGWTALFSASVLATEGVADPVWIGWKKADGTEDGGTIVFDMQTDTSKYCGIVWRITGAADPTVTPPEISTHAFSTGSTTPNPTAVTPTGGAKDYLYLWLGCWQGEQTSPPASQPTNYANPVGANTGTGGAVTTNCRAAGASRQLNAASDDPAAWTISASDSWSAWTVAIHPAPIVPAPAPRRRRPAHRFMTMR